MKTAASSSLPTRSTLLCIALRLGTIASGIFLAEHSSATPLVQVDATTYKTEHCLFVIDSTVTWSSPATAYNDLYAPGAGPVYFPKLAGYFGTLTTLFPGNYFSVCYIANTGASNVPNYINRTYKGTGISNGAGSSGIGAGSGVTPGTYDAVDLCRYNLPGGYLISPALAVFDHEIGHAWGAQIFYTLNPPMLANGHWLPNSTVDCQLGGGTIAAPYLMVDKIYGDPVNGFRWQHVDNARSNDFAVFSEQTLYLMGVSPTFPTSYVLNNPVFNADHTMSSSSIDTFDHAAAVSTYGVRNPDYKTSPKKFKLGFVYVARDLAEVNTVYQTVEQSINSFCNDEAISTTTFRSQTPFLCDARYRASVDGLLADLDGNATPALSVTTSYVSSTDGNASVGFTASDPDGGSPTVSLVPSSPHASVSGSTVSLSGLPDGVHFFTLKASDSGGKKIFGHFVVEVHRPVSSTAISTQPNTLTVTAGNSATFSLSATGTPSALTYQWYRQIAKTSTWSSLADGGAYSGTNSAALTVSSAPAMDGDQFLCFVSNSTGAATSAAATLVVNETTPVITSEAADKYVTANTSTYFRITAGGAGTFGYFYYQWQRLPSGSSTWTDLIAGNTYSTTDSAQLSISSTTLAMAGDQFRCVVSDSAGSTTSAPATLHVGIAPQITSQPLPVTATAGDTVTYSVTASGTAPFSYEWSRYGTVVGNSASLTLTNVQPSDEAVYGVKISNAFGVTYSNNVNLTVTAAVAVPPVITSQPASQSVTAGTNVTLSVSATGSPAPTYQWTRDGLSLAGATSSTLLLPNVQTTQSGSYAAVATNSAGFVSSTTAILVVSPPLVSPSLTSQPQASATTVGQTVTFSVVAAGTAPLTYQWRKNGAAIAGATSATLSLSNVQSTDAADYSVVVTNSLGSVTSSAVALTVVATATPTAILTGPASVTVTVGQTASFSVTVGGTAPITYQWTKNGVTLAGATASTLTLVNVQAVDAAGYAVTATNAVNSATSATATLTVNPAPTAPTISTQPQSQSVTAGQGAIFSVTATGSAPLSYQWLKDGVVIGGATTSTLTIASAQTTSAGDYVVFVTNAAGSVASAVAPLTVTALLVAPAFTLEPTPITVAVGATASFAATATAATSYVWQRNGTPIAGATSATLTLTNVQLSDTGTFSVVASNAAGSTTSTSAALTVTTQDFSGCYVSSFGSSHQGGEFALVVQRDGTVTLLGRFAAASKAVLATNIVLHQDGSFAVGTPGEAVLDAATDTRWYRGQITGQISGSSVALTAPALGVSGTATRSTAGYGASDKAGLFSALPIAQTTGEAYLLVGEGGEAFLLELGAVGARSGSSSVAADGSLQVTLSPGTVAASHYAGTLTPSGLRGSVTTAGITTLLLPPPSAESRQRLANISSRGFAGGGDQTMIAGFVITGTQPKDVLVRALGPTLVSLGVSNTLIDPRLQILQGSSVILQNDDWGFAGADLLSVTARLGAFPLLTGSRDAALLARLSPGLYSAQVTGAGSTTGIAIVEVYDAGLAAPSGPKVVNISTRAFVGRGEDILIAGFVIEGDAPKRVLLRALGPTLAGYGVAGALSDPLIKLFKEGTLVRENDNWSDGPESVLIASVAAAVGASALPSQSKDSSLLLYLQPGVYSVHVRGVGDSTGIALVEVYEVTD